MADVVQSFVIYSFQNAEVLPAEETPANSPIVELQPNDHPRVVNFVKQWPNDQAPGGVLAVSAWYLHTEPSLW